jgi:hypothetical protein
MDLREIGWDGMDLIDLAYRILLGKAKGKRQWEDQDIGGLIILEWILER